MPARACGITPPHTHTHKLLSLHLRECHICYSRALWFPSHMDALLYNEVFLMNSEYSIGLLRGKKKSMFCKIVSSFKPPEDVVLLHSSD